MAAYSGSVTADTTVTVEDFIALRSSDDATFYNYSILEYLNGYDMFITNLMYDYEEELKSIAITVKFTELEKNKYKYKPYLLAYDIYGSTELKFIIMMLNNIIDPKEFNFDQVKVIEPVRLTSILGRIESANSDYLSYNKSKLASDFKNNDGNTIWS